MKNKGVATDARRDVARNMATAGQLLREFQALAEAITKSQFFTAGCLESEEDSRPSLN